MPWSISSCRVPDSAPTRLATIGERGVITDTVSLTGSARSPCAAQGTGLKARELRARFFSTLPDPDAVDAPEPRAIPIHRARRERRPALALRPHAAGARARRWDRRVGDGLACRGPRPWRATSRRRALRHQQLELPGLGRPRLSSAAHARPNSRERACASTPAIRSSAPSASIAATTRRSTGEDLKRYAAQLPPGFPCCAKVPAMYASPVLPGSGRGSEALPNPDFLSRRGIPRRRRAAVPAALRTPSRPVRPRDSSGAAGGPSRSAGVCRPAGPIPGRAAAQLPDLGRTA